MKKTILYLFALILLVGAGSCNKDEINSQSIFVDPTTPPSTFDTWLLNNYTYPYNIEFKYKMEDLESPLTYQLAPARIENSIAMAKLLKYLWIEAYNEHVGIDFLQTHVPRVIHLVGSGAYNTNNTVVLGTAEGGMKITLYAVNDLDIVNPSIAQLNTYHLRTMHHEFAHILHQTKNYPAEFKLITVNGYMGDDWDKVSQANALRAGFISAYSMKSYDEDFVELIAHYIINTQTWWNAQLTTAGTNGKALIEEKITVVKGYLKSTWNIDIDEMRRIVQERANNINNLDLQTL
ncbi:MAG: putative zinc-binding metallopeptidase [Prevotellaceae bacterium]|nr:putative zinc-binding metallopeptidase [Prevotellaceae bacterium]